MRICVYCASSAHCDRAYIDAGADIIHVSSGQVSKDEAPIYGRMFQVPFSDRIRNDVGIPTITVGNVFEWDHVNTIVAAGRADLVDHHLARELGRRDVEHAEGANEEDEQRGAAALGDVDGVRGLVARRPRQRRRHSP